MPINVRPEFIDAAAKFLEGWEPSVSWKDTCLCLTVAAFGQKVFDGEIMGCDSEAEQIAEHCRANNITHHSINADGLCNMGCC